jgi:hypothetical protein
MAAPARFASRQIPLATRAQRKRMSAFRGIA